MSLTIRQMTLEDLDDVMLIQESCYAKELLEPRDLMRSRIKSSSKTCFMLDDGEGPAAYIFTYLSQLHKVTPLEGEFITPENPNCIYIHDMAVLPRANGKGIASILSKYILNITRSDSRVRYSGLVSVQDSHRFWERLGYKEVIITDKEQLEHIKSYEIPAIYMAQELHKDITPPIVTSTLKSKY